MKTIGFWLLTGLLAPLSALADANIVNRLAAVVNDAVITSYEVEMAALPGIEGLRRIFADKPDNATTQEALAREYQKLMEENLEMLVDRQLVLYDYRISGLNIPDSIIEDEIQRRIHERYGDRANLMAKELIPRGISYERYRQDIREEIIVVLMRQRNVSSVIVISPAKIEQFYAANLTNYNVGDQLKLRAIVLNVPTPEESADVRKRGLEIVSKLEAGAPFHEMASVYSEGSQRREGGDWGWKEKSQLSKGLADVAFDLKAGQRSNLIGLSYEPDETSWVYYYDKAGALTTVRKYSRDGTLLEERKGGDPGFDPKTVKEPKEYNLLLVEERRTAHTKGLLEVQQTIEEDLLSKEVKRLQKKWLQRLRNKSLVRYF